VIRTVWLGLVLFFGLAGLALYKLAFLAPPPMAVVQASAVGANRDMPEVGTGPVMDTGLVMDTLTKSDRFPATYISSVEPLATELQVPEELPSVAVPEVISRHHDASDLKAEKGGTKKVKSNDLKKHVRRVQRKPTPPSCNPDEVSPLRRLFAATICSN
jgi:hypothetical protein